jgi:molybdopterin-guanine dinucleotide biosynthesis protein
MTAKLLLHIHEHPDGRVIVTPVDFPAFSVDAETYEAARAGAVSRATRQLGLRSGSPRSALAAPVTAELDSVEVAVAVKRAEPVWVTIGLVVLVKEVSTGRLFLVRAPEVPEFQTVVSDRSQLHEIAKEELRRILGRWNLDIVLACDQKGTVRLEVVEVEFPPARTAGSDDDSFDIAEAAEDLTVLAAQGRLGRFDRRDLLIDRVLAALSSTGRSSVVLVGAPDVGKTALVHELAARLAAGEVPPALSGRALRRLSANELIAGARYTGMWQERARLLVESGRAERAIFAMGDPAGIVDAGKWSESDNNLGRHLRPYVESGDLT